MTVACGYCVISILSYPISISLGKFESAITCILVLMPLLCRGVTIGDNCIIGCGTIVTHDIPANSIAVGVPGRVIESVGKYAAKHDDDFMHTKKMAIDEKKAFVLGHLR